MKEQNDNLQPETIDQVIEGSTLFTAGPELSTQDHQTSHLIQQLQTGSQEYAHENEQSLNRIWSRMAQSQTHTIFLPTQWRKPEALEESREMQEHNNDWGIDSPIHISRPKKRRSRLLVANIVAAVALITIVSFTVFSSVLGPALSKTGQGLSGIVGAPWQRQTVSNGKLVCSITENITETRYGFLWLSWSTQGQIARVDDASVQALSAKNCTRTFSQAIGQSGAVWSPDGNKLALVSNHAMYVLDNHGNVIAHQSFTQPKMLGVSYVNWTSDGKKLTFLSQDTQDQYSIKRIDISSGNIDTLKTLPAGSSPLPSNFKLSVTIQEDKTTLKRNFVVWDTNSGKKISVLPFPQPLLAAVALSPDGSQLAILGYMQIQIYATASGKLLSSFHVETPGGSSRLVWSPDGTYLAVSTDNIKIYDGATQKMVATFGKFDPHNTDTVLVWAPDSKGLATSTTQVLNNTHGNARNTLNVWALT